MATYIRAKPGAASARCCCAGLKSARANASAKCRPAGQVILRGNTAAVDQNASAMFKAEGFALVRQFWRMEIETDRAARSARVARRDHAAHHAARSG